MTSPDDDDPGSLRDAELLDELLTAIQRGDIARRDALLEQGPWLRDVVGCLSALDRLMPAQIAPEFAPTMLGTGSPTPALNTRPMEGSEVFGKYDLLGESRRAVEP